jgi:hypothetical protein
MTAELTNANAATTPVPMVEDQKPLPDVEAAFTQATEHLITLYRTVERRSLDLPVLSFMPFVIFVWEVLKFTFFVYIGVLLIVPVNLVILCRNFLCRNCFPGRWRYRPFFLRQLYYVWLWTWRGEAATAPLVFIRPMFNIFMRGHFENRLRRLRSEIALQESISDATRTALLARLDAALERWKSPHFVAIFWTVLLPGLLAVPTWSKQITDLLGYFNIHVPINVIAPIVSSYIPRAHLWTITSIVIGYLLAIPVTAFLAKRGLFIGRNLNRIWFPGGQEGAEVYLKEREILATVKLHARELRIDLWIVSAILLLSVIFTWLDPSLFLNGPESISDALDMALNPLYFGASDLIMIALMLCIAAFRRRKIGRL